MGFYSLPYKIRNPWQTFTIVVRGDRPKTEVPPFTNEEIDMLRSGWDQDPTQRPNIYELLETASSLSVDLINDIKKIE